MTLRRDVLAMSFLLDPATLLLKGNEVNSHNRRVLTLRIVVEKPPAGVDYGVQSGHGSNYDTVQTVRSCGDDLHFEFSVEVKEGSRRAPPDFRGPMVQGPAGARFVYLDIGTCAGQADTPWSRRLKIPLTGITWDTIEKASAPRRVLEARVPGTGRDGGPTCATVKEFDGWNITRSASTHG
jgi:hypothetical protein